MACPARLFDLHSVHADIPVRSPVSKKGPVPGIGKAQGDPGPRTLCGHKQLRIHTKTLKGLPYHMTVTIIPHCPLEDRAQSQFTNP